ncbi:MAG TPA: hypothetical protein DEB10_03365 [Ruminococcaceae bacterium]|nr:hypothetical protein [Oscillospiraceae bacterium]HCA28569.1 hypothetical protein [Oscillospiraceae bacterium]
MKILRKSRKLTQNDISRVLNLNRSTYAYYESGKIEPSLQTIIQLSDFYDVSTDYLLKGNKSGET